MTYILSLLILVPLVGAVVAWFVGTSQRAAKIIALGFSLIETTLATLLLIGFINPGWAVFFGAPTATPPPTPGAYVPLYYMERYSGWSQFGFNYIVGVDGLSVPLIWLTTLLTTLAIVFHWDQENRPQAFFGLFLFLEMTLVGVFMSLDLLLFAVFWELVIIPMFFLIGIWGGPNRRYAAFKFFIFTQVGFVIMLLSIFTLYFNSAGVNAAVYGTNANTLDMTAFLHAALRHQTGALATYLTVGLQIPIFAAFLIGFLVKLPSFPFHTWLPDAHVEAPTGGSVLLAGVLLKMGGYGLFRINLGILPDAAKNLWWVLAVLGTVSMVYAAFVCLAQVDLKRLIAYSSIGHMGFVLLGASSLTRRPGRDLPVVQPWHHHGNPIHARRLGQACHRHSGHLRASRPCEGDAAILARARHRIFRIGRAPQPQFRFGLNSWYSSGRTDPRISSRCVA